MDLGLRGKTALVCGASKGLGYASAEALAREGVNLVVVARGEDALAAASDRLRASGATVVPVATDIATPEGRERALAAAPQAGASSAAQFDIVVTNAGGPPAGNFREFTAADWLDAINTNMLSAIELIRLTVDGMIERRWGRIVNITSTAVKAPSAYLPLSNGARCGLSGFVAGVAREVAPYGVTINNLLPGVFDTDRLAGNFATVASRDGVSAAEVRERRRTQTAPQRFGHPDELGAWCAFICSAQASYLNAQNILLDGGTYPGTF